MAAWTDEEVELLHDCMLRGYGPSQISSEFTAKGFSRSIGAIRAKKAKEISIARKDADAEYQEAITLDDTVYPEVKEESILDWYVTTFLVIGALIVGWWFIS